MITPDGIKPDSDKAETIKHFPLPVTVKDMRWFLIGETSTIVSWPRLLTNQRSVSLTKDSLGCMVYRGRPDVWNFQAIAGCCYTSGIFSARCTPSHIRWWLRHSGRRRRVSDLRPNSKHKSSALIWFFLNKKNLSKTRTWFLSTLPKPRGRTPMHCITYFTLTQALIHGFFSYIYRRMIFLHQKFRIMPWKFNHLYSVFLR